ncbi:MAG: glycoside hydrolase family 1 protein [Acidimicrobiales bacterium]
MPTFPEGFRWGVATAAHQIEGGCWNNDWWQWEHTPGSGVREPSGDACDSWNRWRDDVALVADLGLNTYRFSIEWSRIEPEAGAWSTAALDHYRQLGAALLERGVQPMITFHHFTTPRWVAADGGWAEDRTADRFASFCERAAAALAPVMGAACTLNEPNIVALSGYLVGAFPPGERSVERRRQANRVFLRAHRLGVEAIRTGAPGVPVGLTLAMTDYQARPGGEAYRDRVRRSMQDIFLEVTDGDDFLGVQTYSRAQFGPGGAVRPEPGSRIVETMGYERWPDALEATLRRAWDLTGGAVPLIVTECGIATEDDRDRIRYVHETLEGVLRCIADGVTVGGYLYWSLLDNFEWALGYRPHFGLVAVDRSSFARSPKPSAHWLGRVAKANQLQDP